MLGNKIAPQKPLHSIYECTVLKPGQFSLDALFVHCIVNVFFIFSITDKEMMNVKNKTYFSFISIIRYGIFWKI